MPGKKGFGAKISYDSGSSTFVDFANVQRIRPFAAKADSIDVTSMESANQYREKLPGLLDSGDAQFDLNYDDKSATHAWLMTNIGVVSTFKVTFPGASPTTATFSGFLSSVPPDIPHDNKMVCSVVITISGKVTIA